MFGSTTLDIVIGLLFIFLLYSLLASVILEIIAVLFGLRARNLSLAIGRMLGDEAPNLWSDLKNMVKQLYGHVIQVIQYIYPLKIKTKVKDSLQFKFYDDPAIKYLGEDKLFKKPSFISSENFANTLVNVLTDNSSKQLKLNSTDIDNQTKEHLQYLFSEANTDINEFKSRLENWFNETMDRATGWYKRKTRFTLVIIGFVLAISFNANTFEMVRILSKDKEAREQLVQLALQSSEFKNALPIENATNLVAGDTLPVHQDTLLKKLETLLVIKDSLYQDIEEANMLLGQGWEIPDSLSIIEQCYKVDSLKCGICWDKFFVNNDPTKISMKIHRKILYVICLSFRDPVGIIGYLLTALAVSLGSPFWFDLISKILQLRGGSATKTK